MPIGVLLQEICPLAPTHPAPHRTHKRLEQVSAEQTQGGWLGEQRDIWSALQGEDSQRGPLADGAGAHPYPRKPDLHEGAVEERSLGDDEVGAKAAGNGLLCS